MICRKRLYSLLWYAHLPHLVLTLLAILLLITDNRVAQPGVRSPVQEVTRDGVKLQLQMETLDGSDVLLENRDVRVRLTITDASGEPLSSASPGGWMGRRQNAGRPDTRLCNDMVETFISGTIFQQPDVNLNIYYVLVLNQDPTVSVVDPLFGFGTTKTLTMIPLASPGYDWALSSVHNRLFVSQPEAAQVAVVDTHSFKGITQLPMPAPPGAMRLQPDEQYLWVGYGDGTTGGVVVFETQSHREVARISTGTGPHQFAFSQDNRYVFVTHAAADSVSVIDVHQLQKVNEIATGPRPVSIDRSDLSQAVYVSHAGDGSIVAIDTQNHAIRARIQADAGLGQLRFAPGHRYGFVVNPKTDQVHIFDAVDNRVIQHGKLESGPDHVVFSDELAYVRHQGNETVLMIPLKAIGTPGAPIQVVDFPGGQDGFGPTTTPADGIIQAPGENSVLVAHPVDQQVYYYREGMAAPMGSFKNYRRAARAVLVVDRTLQERSLGTYETVVRLGPAGIYDVPLYINTPRLIHCFEIAVNPAPETEQPKPPVRVELRPEHDLWAQEEARIDLRLVDPQTEEPIRGIQDLHVRALLAPGIWQQRYDPVETEPGIYRLSFVPPRPGAYYLYVQAPSQDITAGGASVFTFMIQNRTAKTGSK